MAYDEATSEQAVCEVEGVAMAVTMARVVVSQAAVEQAGPFGPRSN